MKCRYCESETRVAETRRMGEFYTMRRRVCLADPAHRFETMEVLKTFLLRATGRKRRQEELDRNVRGAERRRKATARREEIKKRVRVGEKYEFIAEDMRISVGTVRKHVKALRGGVSPPRGRPPNGERRL